MKTITCGWLKRKPVNKFSPAVVVFLFLVIMCVALILIIFNANGNEIVNRFGIGIFVGGITYAASSIDKIPKKPMSIALPMLIIGLILVGITANYSDVYCKVFNGIGTGMCVGSVTYFIGTISRQNK